MLFRCVLGVYYPLYVMSSCVLPVVRHVDQVCITAVRHVVQVRIVRCMSRCPVVYYLLYVVLSRCVLPAMHQVYQMCITCFTLRCPGVYYRDEALAAMTKWHKYTCVRFVPWVKGETKQKYELTAEWHVTITKRKR